MEKELQDMPKALRVLANEINAPDHIPAMCLRDAATIIESLVVQRDRERREAEEFRDDMRIHLTEGPCIFSWEDD